MSGLPSGLSDPLHIGPPFPWWAVVLGALLLTAIAWLWLRSRRRGRARAGLPPPPAPVGTLAAILRAIGELRERYAESGSFREAAHELSAALRAHFELRGKHRFSTLTSGEIGRKLGDTAMTRFFLLLSDVQFRRRDPVRNDFEGLCDLAESLVRVRGEGEAS